MYVISYGSVRFDSPPEVSAAPPAALQSLHLEGPVNWHGDYNNFSAASLSGLTRLHSLSLACFYDYELRWDWSSAWLAPLMHACWQCCHAPVAAAGDSLQIILRY